LAPGPLSQRPGSDWDCPTVTVHRFSYPIDCWTDLRSQ